MSSMTRTALWLSWRLSMLGLAKEGRRVARVRGGSVWLLRRPSSQRSGGAGCPGSRHPRSDWVHADSHARSEGRGDAIPIALSLRLDGERCEGSASADMEIRGGIEISFVERVYSEHYRTRSRDGRQGSLPELQERVPLTAGLVVEHRIHASVSTPRGV